MAKKVEVKNHYNKVEYKKVDDKVVAVKPKNEEQSMTKFILKTAGITLATLIITVFYVFSILITIAPVIPAKIFSAIGAKQAVTICYEREFKRNPNIYTMYDVIRCAVSSDDNDRVVAYTTVFITMKEYENFVDEMDAEAIAKTPINKVAYVYDLDSYLHSIYIKGLYEQNDTATIRTLYIGYDESRKDEHPYTISMVPFVSALYSDTSKTEEQKTEEMTQWVNGVHITGVGDLLDVLERRLDAIEDLYDTLDSKGQIYNLYAQIKVNNCFYKAYKMLGEDYASEQAVYGSRVSTLTATYNELISA